MIVTNNDTSISAKFSYYIKVTKFVGTDRIYLSRSIIKKGFYKGQDFTVKKNNNFINSDESFLG